MSLLNQSILYSIGEVLPKLIGFFLLPVYTHYLSNSDYGVLSYTSAFVMFLYILCVLSLNTFVLRYYFELSDERSRKRLIGNIFLTIGIFNTLLSLFFYFLLPKLISSYNLQVPWEPYFKLALINNFLEVFSIIPLVFYRVRQQAKKFVLLSLGKTLLQMLLTVILIVGFEWGVLGHYYGRLFAIIPFFFIYWYIILSNVELNINLIQLKNGLIFSLPLLPGALAYLALTLSDRIILERFVSVADIGVYSLACTLALTLNIIIQSFYKAIEPEIFKRFGTDSFECFINQIQKLFFFIIYSMSMGLTLFSQEVFKLMATEEFYRGYLLMPILVIGVIMTGQNVIFGSIIIAEKKTNIMGMATMAGATVSLILNLLFVQYGGIYVASIVSAVSFTIMDLLLFANMDVNSKSLYKPMISMLLFIFFSFGTFYFLRLSVSLEAFILKLIIFFTYVFIVMKIFKINLNSIKNLKRSNTILL